MEFGIIGESPIESEDPGFAVFSLGLLTTFIGLVWFAVAGYNAKTLSAWQIAGVVILPACLIPLATFGAGWLVWGYILAREKPADAYSEAPGHS